MSNENALWAAAPPQLRERVLGVLRIYRENAMMQALEIVGYSGGVSSDDQEAQEKLMETIRAHSKESRLLLGEALTADAAIEILEKAT